MIDSYDSIKDSTVKIALLSSTMKLFFIRPPEVQQMLGRLLAQATDDVSSQDLHDRALIYYRMLKSGVDPETIQNVIKTNTVISDGVKFSEEDDFELRAELMKEFNTLSIIFGKVSSNFIADEFAVKFVKQPKDHPLEPGSAAASAPPEVPETNGGYAPGDADLMGGGGGYEPSAPAAPPAPAPAPDLVDLLGFGDPTPAATPAPPPPLASSGGPAFSASATMTGDEYQEKWGAVNDSESIVTMIPMRGIPNNTDEVENKLANHNVMTMASGELPTEFKFFLYAQETASGALVLIQGNIQKGDEPLLILTVKVHGGDGLPDQQKVDKLSEVMTQALS
jgi:hypothetical protein